MKSLSHNFLLIATLLVFETLFAQKQRLSDFYLIQRKYEDLNENDSTALPLVRKLIKKAKDEKNDYQLYLGYTDARFHSPDPHKKLLYADSAIVTAIRTKNDSLLSSAYLSKGIIYYFNFKKYKLALDEYLKAYSKNKNCTDPYYTNKINYHIGVVKSYIGYYKEALVEFTEARKFFALQIKKEMHPNLMRGNLRGYYNTIHQMAVCYRNLKDYKKADSLVAIGISGTATNNLLKQEHSYFLKELGINSFHKGDYQVSVNSLNGSLINLVSIDDFAWLTVCYSYLGKSHWKLGQIDEGIKDFEKIDSIFLKHSFVLPEVRSIYEDLIDYYGDKNESSKMRYYMGQLLKVDKVLERDFIYLTPKIYRDYDTNKLLQEISRLDRKKTIERWISVLILITLLFGGFYLLLRYFSKKKPAGKNSFLGINFGSHIPFKMEEGTYRVQDYTKSNLSPDIVDGVLSNLEKFEANNEYLKSKIKISDLALRFGVTEDNLSSILKEYKGANFSRYLNELRISYVMQKIASDPKYQNYSSSAIAEECGLGSRQNFSTLFHKISGITFENFVKQCRSEPNK